MKESIVLMLVSMAVAVSCKQEKGMLFSDNYTALPRGPLGSNVGAHTEYHFLHEAKPKGNWAISAFRHNVPESIVVWDPLELWVYTQEDNPKEGDLYKPERNPLYNYSNYQATVSLPGWKQ